VPSPEVVRFRPGRFRFEFLAQDAAFHVIEQRIADRSFKQAKRRAARAGTPRGGSLHVPKHLHHMITCSDHIYTRLLDGYE
jgi:hypothetical protein